MANGITAEVNQYRIVDGTKTGELLTVRPFGAEQALNRDEFVLGMTAIKLLDIQTAARQEHFGVEVPDDFNGAKAAIRTHTLRHGSYQFASFGDVLDSFQVYEGAVGYIKHRPIYGLFGKIATRIGFGNPDTLSPTKAYIHNIDVLPEEHQSGIGSAIMDAALRSYPPSDTEVVLEALGEPGYTHQWFQQLGLSKNPDVALEPLVIDGVELAQTRFDGASVMEVITRLDAERVD